MLEEFVHNRQGDEAAKFGENQGLVLPVSTYDPIVLRLAETFVAKL
jgi:hypothetical protein